MLLSEHFVRWAGSAIGGHLHLIARVEGDSLFPLKRVGSISSSSTDCVGQLCVVVLAFRSLGRFGHRGLPASHCPSQGRLASLVEASRLDSLF